MQAFYFTLRTSSEHHAVFYFLLIESALHQFSEFRQSSKTLIWYPGAFSPHSADAALRFMSQEFFDYASNLLFDFY